MFTIKQKELNTHLQTLSSVVDSKSASDPVDKIMDGIHFDVGQDKVVLTTSSSDMQVTTTLKGEYTQKPCQFTVNARNLADVVHTLPSLLDIEFTVDDLMVKIRCGKSQFQLPNLSSTPYPILNIKSTENLISIEAKALKQALKAVSFSMGSHHLRYFLAGCMVRVQDGKIVFVATDTHRLSYYHIENKNFKESSRSLLLPKKAIGFIDKILPSTNEPVEIFYGEGDFLILSVMETTIKAKLVVSAYPDFERVFAQEMTKKALMDSQHFKESLMRAAVIANDKFRTVRFTLEKGKIVIESKSSLNEMAKTEADINYDDETISFNFNAGYFIDLYNNFDEKVTQLSFIDDRASVVVSFEGNSQFKYILMPLRV